MNKTLMLLTFSVLGFGLAQATEPQTPPRSGQTAPAPMPPGQTPPAPPMPGMPMPAAQMPPPQSGLTSHIIVTPKEVTWGDCPPMLPRGAQCAVVQGDPAAANALFALRAKFPNNYRIQPHFHPADEHVVVISGTMNIGSGDKFDTKAGHALPAGSFTAIPKGHHHYAWAKGETVIQIHAVGPWGLTYVDPKDDPRNTAQ